MSVKTERFVGVDIGGANLKFASQSKALCVPFDLWRQPNNLAQQLRRCLEGFETFDGLAVTMTGELADCFASRKDGVKFICQAVDSICGPPIPRYYQTNGRFVRSAEAINNWQQTAASNWHATASFVAQTHSDCIVVDCGSTTTDIVPIAAGKVVANGYTDFERLTHSELVYTGASRTPIAVVLKEAQLDGRRIAVVAECFATVNDAYLILKFVDEDAQSATTADGRPATRKAAHRRLAKMVCLDEDEVSRQTIHDFANQIYQAQIESIANAIRAVRQRNAATMFVGLGNGIWLAEAAIREACPMARIERFASPAMLTVGPAFAIQQLYQSMA